tara:strand:+ start:1995 stop:2585 length:591 start_codon:yes stop_codon:yes gene_type:complete
MGSDLSLQIIDNIFQKELNEHKETLKTLNSFSERIYFIHNAITKVFDSNKKLLICGNGGSAADAQHFSSELTGRYEKERKSLPAISLTTDSSALTSISNDFGFENVFLRQIEGLGDSGDLLFAISTSGNSRNILKAIRKAKEMNIKTIGLLGGDGGEVGKEIDYSITINSFKTCRIQEMHGLIIHILCKLIDKNYT